MSYGREYRNGGNGDTFQVIAIDEADIAHTNQRQCASVESRSIMPRPQPA